ncbi:MAG: hypothetical protein GF346_05830, partial [Candidatus Eisenbacteria bacterium]|nr:hypothetical protein [Candidatus Latescibacterota bacterium]MBD3301948.1 hypothetical protein [Candidatus Eisenbacteria bacterium]
MNRIQPTRPTRARALATLAMRSLGLFSALCFVVLPAPAAEWAGEEVMEDGTLQVRNPAEPMNGTVSIQAERLWKIGGDTDAENEFFGLIARMTRDEEGNLYLLDSQLAEVKVFSPEGEWIRTIGREGEGPGEFRSPSGLFFMPDGNLGVLQAAPPKVVILTPEGDPAGEMPAPEVEGEGFPALIGGRYAGDHLVIAAQTSNFDQEKGTFAQNIFLAAVDPEGQQLARYHEQNRLWEFANPVIAETTWDTFQN